MAGYGCNAGKKGLILKVWHKERVKVIKIQFCPANGVIFNGLCVFLTLPLI